MAVAVKVPTTPAVKTKPLSARLPEPLFKEFVSHANKSKLSQSDYLRKILSKEFTHQTELQFEKGGVLTSNDKFVTDDIRKLMVSLGAGTAAGFLGYKLAGIIREQMDMDESKGLQTLIGLGIGMATLLLVDKAQG